LLHRSNSKWLLLILIRNLPTKQTKSEDLISFAILQTNLVEKKLFKSPQVMEECNLHSIMITKMPKMQIIKIKKNLNVHNLISLALQSDVES